MNIFTANCSKPLVLGRMGENIAVTLQFPIKKWREEFGNGTFSLLHQRNGDEAPYPVVITEDENMVYWTVTASDVQKKGFGRAELIYIVGDLIAKSEIFTTSTGEALGQQTTPPEPWEAWVNQVLAAGAAAEEAMTHAPMIDEETNHWLIWNKDAEEYEDTGVDAKGIPGDPGEPGDDGISPHIGANGNWFIGETDTGVHAQGPQGDPGETGPEGPQGETGPEGPAGADADERRQRRHRRNGRDRPSGTGRPAGPRRS